MVKLKDIIVLDCHVHPRKYINVSLVSKIHQQGWDESEVPDYTEIPLNVRNVAYYGDYPVISIGATDGILDVVVKEPTNDTV